MSTLVDTEMPVGFPTVSAPMITPVRVTVYDAGAAPMEPTVRFNDAEPKEPGVN